MTENRDQADRHSGEERSKSNTHTTLPKELSNTSFFQQFIGLVPDGAIAIDEDGIIVFANAAVTNILGYSPNELVGEPLKAIIIDDHQPRIPSADDRSSEDTTDRLNLRAQHADGYEVQIVLNVHKLTLDGHRLLAGFVHNRAHHEEAERSSDHYEIIAELAGDAVYQLDCDGNFVMVSDSVVKLTGYSRNELLGEHISMLLDEEIVAQDTNVVTELLTTEEKWVETGEFEFYTAEGETIPCEVQMARLESNGKTQGMVSIARDVSKRKERVEELRQERGLIEHVLETSPVGIGVISPEGDISRVNDRAEELLDLTMEEISNQTFDVSQRKLYNSEGQPVPPEDLLHRVFDDGEQVLNSEFTLERPNGDRVWAAISIAPMTDGNGMVEKAVIIATDITDRKEREETLREERDVIEHVLETSPVGIGVINPEGDISRVNDRAEELFGLTDYELTNQTFDVSQRRLYDSAGQQLSPEGLLERVFDDGDRVLDTEFELGQPDGNRVWLSISIAPIESQAGYIKKAVIIGKDVTDRKEREETLREERDVIEHILETSPVGIGVINPEGDISRVNDQAEDLLGLTIEEITNQTLDVSQRKFYSAGGQRIPPEDLLHRVFDDGEQVLNSEFTLERPDGDRVWVAISIAPIESPTGAVEKAVVIATDISDRKERERRMRESEARLRQIAENINSAIWMADAGMSEILYINPAYEAITGRSRDSVYDSLLNHLDAVHPQDQQRVGDAMKKAPQASGNETGALRFQEKYRIIRPDGSTRWVHSFAFPLQNDDGDVYRFVGVIDDITEVKEQQLELGRQRDELETLNQINTVIRQVNQGLVQATTRGEIATQVCKTLTNSNLYHAAWIGEVDSGIHKVEPKTGTGIGSEILDTSFATGEVTPIAITVKSGDVQIIRSFDNLPAEIAIDNPSNQSRFMSGQPFAAVIPLVYKDTVYDVLVAYSSRANAFSVREQAVLHELGKTIGLAINAVERKKALLTDTVMELEFEISDQDLFFVTVSAETGAAFEMEGIVSQSDGSYLQYFTVTDASPGSVLERAEADDSITRARLVTDHEETALIEFLVAGASPATILAEYGATVHSAMFADGKGTVRAAMSQRGDVRVAVEAVQSMFTHSELVSKHERELSVQTNQEFQMTLEEALTERQSATLETAYYAGFFEWPRDSSGEDMAESLGIAPATFHQHARTGVRKLVEILVDDADNA
ncbi:PAS domain S-box protein [Haladaptatus halobius]|uniref:PAS domain S-box protein n=1 Tax=Haladaptatus halobius TaxID=2884875 RepID=UPI001D0BDF62|nr:PAS domain S-box protein [Haladaptatus halobius]